MALISKNEDIILFLWAITNFLVSDRKVSGSNSKQNNFIRRRKKKATECIENLFLQRYSKPIFVKGNIFSLLYYVSMHPMYSVLNLKSPFIPFSIASVTRSVAKLQILNNCNFMTSDLNLVL